MKILFLLITTLSILFCAPAFHGKKIFELENGETFQGYVKGDEYLNWIESERGEVLLFNNRSNRYEYAQILDNELIASGVEKKLHVKTRTAVPSLKKESLYKLWKEKRSKARNSRRE